MSGSFLVNGKPRDENRFRRQSAYVQQDDVLYAHQVRPHLLLHPRVLAPSSPCLFCHSSLMDCAGAAVFRVDDEHGRWAADGGGDACDGLEAPTPRRQRR